MKLKDISLVCFLIVIGFLLLYIFSYNMLQHLSLANDWFEVNGELLALTAYSLAAIAFFLLLGLGLRKCDQAIKENTILRIQQEQELSENT